MVAEKSDVLLNNPRLGGLVFLQLDVAPFCEAPTLPAQRLP
ncbi:MAG TPA: hypothetical protein VMU81_10380 [Acetobacteraceae bacterium]|nr:hypothetical protein [Acetobacteraceae bacterium]